MHGQIIDVYTHGGLNWHLLWNLDVGSKKAIVFDDGRKAEIGALMRYEEGGEETAEEVSLEELPEDLRASLPIDPAKSATAGATP